MKYFKELAYRIKWHIRGYIKSRRLKKLHSDPFYDRFDALDSTDYRQAEYENSFKE